jgi:membrane-associated phospholipid phosphatase
MEWLSDAFTFVSLLIGNEFVFSLVLGALVFFTERRPQKRKKIILAILITFLLVVALKNVFAVQRPCRGELAESGCPDLFLSEYSFPSGHAAMAFLVMVAFLDKPTFPLFWAFALLVSATRLYLGVHTFEDIAGSLVLAPIAYYITDVSWRRYFG